MVVGRRGGGGRAGVGWEVDTFIITQWSYGTSNWVGGGGWGWVQSQ